MKQTTFVITFLLAITCSTYAQETFTLSSQNLGGQATINEEFDGFGCVGKNTSPELTWKNAPEGTKSFAVTMYDPDAPTGSGWWHWLIFDIAPDINQLVPDAGNIQSGLAPKGAIQSITDYGTQGYGGPCPPEGHGFHQYIITVYALDIQSLGLNANTNAAIVGFNLGNHTLAKASLVAYYKREKK
ncbi:YbhB/YbcL family Raf kinase inhibitor-like protein [Ochrovirga pacifica]|uniref:YbhB/YbcL family Raf kinase inhibitor-like protein n=1 Tax=Ochrovirga pacifica TaxID=1042376 RepID=UPI000255A52B|nr:YbhB/YbcL family Raf kinase inhibitor-like protein [Ochrovirga pacifica]